MQTWMPDTRCVNVSSSRYGELISRPVPATKMGQAPSGQYRATPSVLNILAIYLVSSSGVADPSLTSEGLAMSLPSLGSAVGSRFTCGSPWNRHMKKSEDKLGYYHLENSVKWCEFPRILQ